jgi:hypothetical protein
MNTVDLGAWINRPLTDLVEELNEHREGIDMTGFDGVIITEGDIRKCIPPSLQGLLGVVRTRITPDSIDGGILLEDEP